MSVGTDLLKVRPPSVTSELPTLDGKETDRQCSYNVTSWRVRLTIVAVQKKNALCVVELYVTANYVKYLGRLCNNYNCEKNNRLVFPTFVVSLRPGFTSSTNNPISETFARTSGSN